MSAITHAYHYPLFESGIKNRFVNHCCIYVELLCKYSNRKIEFYYHDNICMYCWLGRVDNLCYSLWGNDNRYKIGYTKCCDYYIIKFVLREYYVSTFLHSTRFIEAIVHSIGYFNCRKYRIAG